MQRVLGLLRPEAEEYRGVPELPIFQMTQEVLRCFSAGQIQGQGCRRRTWLWVPASADTKACTLSHAAPPMGHPELMLSAPGFKLCDTHIHSQQEGQDPSRMQ